MTLILLALSGSAHGAPAPAPQVAEADEQRARELFELGRSLYAEGQYEAAIAAWNACHDLFETHDLKYNIASAYEKLGDLPRAIQALREYRDAASTDEERQTSDRKLHALESRLRNSEQWNRPLPAEAGRKTVPRWLTTAGIAVGGASLIVGTGLGIRAVGARSDIGGACISVDEGFMCSRAALDPLDRYRSLSTASLVTLSIGAVLTGTSIGVLISDGAKPAGVVLTTRF